MVRKKNFSWERSEEKQSVSVASKEGASTRRQLLQYVLVASASGQEVTGKHQRRLASSCGPAVFFVTGQYLEGGLLRWSSTFLWYELQNFFLSHFCRLVNMSCHNIPSMNLLSSDRQEPILLLCKADWPLQNIVSTSLLFLSLKLETFDSWEILKEKFLVLIWNFWTLWLKWIFSNMGSNSDVW